MELQNPPTDCISHIKLKELLLVSSWDRKLRIYDPSKNILLETFNYDFPILKSDYLNSTTIVSTDIKGGIYTSDVVKNKSVNKIETDCGGLQCLQIKDNLLFAAGWNKKLAIIENNKIIDEINLNGKAYCSDLLDNLLVFGLSDGTVNIYDIRNMNTVYYEKSYPLKPMIRCIKIDSKIKRFYCGMADGKIRVEYLDLSKETQLNNFAFNCHRMVVDGVKTIYPVNSIDININGDLISGGSDGSVVSWNINSKKVVKEILKRNNSVSCISAEGGRVAVSFSYLFEKGLIDHPLDSIYIVN